jgi:hypothetical protein
MFHGIVLDAEFDDPSYPERLELFAKRKSVSTGWIIFGIKVSETNLTNFITDIQSHLKTDKPYYTHLYNDEKVVVIFKDKVFEVTSQMSSWGSAVEYGERLGIPKEQLDFWPNRFQDEIHYFKKEDFVN